MPMSGIGSYRVDVEVPGRDAEATLQANLRRVSADYLSLLEIPVVAGRGIAISDREGTEPVAVVSRALAKRLFGIYERAIPDAERALSAARSWAQAAPADLDALRALAERLDPATDARERVRALDARADELIRQRDAADAQEPAALRDEALEALDHVEAVHPEGVAGADHRRAVVRIVGRVHEQRDRVEALGEDRAQARRPLVGDEALEHPHDGRAIQRAERLDQLLLIAGDKGAVGAGAAHGRRLISVCRGACRAGS